MSTSEALFAGVDVAAGRVNAVLLGGDRARRVEAFYRGPVGCGPVGCGPVGCRLAGCGLAGFCRLASRVAVDAPGGLSAGAHLDDLSVAAKFRGGRCSEIPLRGVPAVPWVTPDVLAQAPGWMWTGFEVWSRLRAAGLEVVEAFPAACFHRLNGGRWPPPKTTRAGRAARLELLSRLVDLPVDGGGRAGGDDGVGKWTHDDIDALAAAVVAARGGPALHRCSRPDGSAMWMLPASLALD